MNGNDKDVCMAEAKAGAHPHRIRRPVAKYNNSEKGRASARSKLADAEYDLAKAKCDAKSGADKDSCMDNAKSVRTAALADAKAGATAPAQRGTAPPAPAAAPAWSPAPTPRIRSKAAAVAKCEEAAWQRNRLPGRQQGQCDD
jgi:hyperosmotically inducible protein